jgi:PAP2 superfamily
MYKNRNFRFMSFLIMVPFNLLSLNGRADIISDWNGITVSATKKAGMNSNLGSRIEAIESIAVYDAVNSIKNIGTPYLYFVHPKTQASTPAAAAKAAHDILVHYFPDQTAIFDSALGASLAKIPDTKFIKEGEEVGTASAAAIIELRKNDGADPDISYPGPAHPGIGQYRPTPAGFKPGIDQQWGHVKPFLLLTDSQYRPLPPPAPGTNEFNKGLAQVAEIGSATSKIRTEDQTHIAQFYKQDAELTVNEAARILVNSHHFSLEENALIFVLTDIAEADARIAIWDAKYTYLFWRPVTALNADPDGTVTNKYAKWTPLISTPPHPSYPCGHCGTVTAGFEVLQTFFGDSNTIELHTTTPGEPARTIHSLGEGEGENEWSRDYGGIHYPFDNVASDHLGKLVASWTLQKGPKRN